MVEPQEPPPQTSRQGGSMTLNEHRRSERQRKRRRSLQRTPRPAEDEAEASTTEEQKLRRRHQRCRPGRESPRGSTKDPSPTQRGRLQPAYCSRSRRRRGSRHGKGRNSHRAPNWIQSRRRPLHGVARRSHCTGRKASEQHRRSSHHGGKPSSPYAGEPPPARNKRPQASISPWDNLDYS